MPEPINNAEFLRKHRATLEKLLQFASDDVDRDDKAFIAGLTPRERAIMVQLGDQLRMLGTMTLRSLTDYYLQHSFASDGEFVNMHPGEL